MPSSRSSSARSALLALLCAAPLAALAKYECNTDLGTYYPYCVNVPDSASDDNKLPLILMLSGSGARNDGDSSKVKSLSGYDGFGKVINQGLSGNTGADQTMAMEKFITVIPISPMYASGSSEVRHWWPEYLDEVLDAVKAKYPVDEDAIHCAGYSMGARGCWRYAVNRPTVLASTTSSAGAAEQAGDGTLSQQKADPTFPLLNKIVDLPVWQFDGSSDTTAGTKSPEATQNQLVKLGSTVSKLTTENTDHSGMSTMPFNTDLMNWMLKQRRSGGSSSSSSADSSDNSSTSAVSSKTKSSSGSNPTASLSPTRNASGTSSSSSSESTSKCKKRRSKRSEPAPHKKVVKRGLTLSAILAATGRGATSKDTPAAPVVVEKRELTLDAMLAARNKEAATLAKAKKDSIAAIESPVERRALMGRSATVASTEKMARRLRL